MAPTTFKELVDSAKGSQICSNNVINIYHAREINPDHYHELADIMIGNEPRTTPQGSYFVQHTNNYEYSAFGGNHRSWVHRSYWGWGSTYVFKWADLEKVVQTVSGTTEKLEELKEWIIEEVCNAIRDLEKSNHTNSLKGQALQFRKMVEKHFPEEKWVIQPRSESGKLIGRHPDGCLNVPMRTFYKKVFNVDLNGFEWKERPVVALAGTAEVNTTEKGKKKKKKKKDWISKMVQWNGALPVKQHLSEAHILATNYNRNVDWQAGFVMFQGFKALYDHPDLVEILDDFNIKLAESEKIVRNLGNITCASVKKFKEAAVGLKKEDRLDSGLFQIIRRFENKGKKASGRNEIEDVECSEELKNILKLVASSKKMKVKELIENMISEDKQEIEVLRANSDSLKDQIDVLEEEVAALKQDLADAEDDIEEARAGGKRKEPGKTNQSELEDSSSSSADENSNA